MRIAHVHADLPPDTNGGVAWQVHRLATAQVERGRDVTVLSFSRGPEGAKYAVRALDGGGVEQRRGLARLVLAPLAIARADTSGFDVVHYHGDSHLARPGCPTVRTFYGSAVDEMWHATGWKFRASQLLVYPMELVAMLRADRAVGISAATRRSLPLVRTLVPCGVDRRVFRPGGERSQEPSILFVGTLEGRKRGKLLVRAFREVVRARLPRARLMMVGEAGAAEEGVEWLGRPDEAALADAYRRAWVFCLPSSYEGFGVPYVEAMASGTPVVATPNPGAREISEDGRSALLVRDGELGDALVGLLSDDVRRQALAAAGLARAAAYDWDEIVTRYDRVYDAVAAGERSWTSAS